MAVQTVTLSAQGVSDPIALPMRHTVNQNALSSGRSTIGDIALVSLLVNFSGGGPASATAQVDISNDPLALTKPTLARWNAHDTLVGLSADANATIIAPLLACRLNLTAWVSGSVMLQVGYPDTN